MDDKNGAQNATESDKKRITEALAKVGITAVSLPDVDTLSDFFGRMAQTAEAMTWLNTLQLTELSSEKARLFAEYLRAFTPAEHVARHKQGLTMKDWLGDRARVASGREGHRIAPEDRERIRCEYCGAPATECVYLRWDTGARKGVSFMNYCDDCIERRDKENADAHNV